MTDENDAVRDLLVWALQEGWECPHCMGAPGGRLVCKYCPAIRPLPPGMAELLPVHLPHIWRQYQEALEYAEPLTAEEQHTWDLFNRIEGWEKRWDEVPDE